MAKMAYPKAMHSPRSGRNLKHHLWGLFFVAPFLVLFIVFKIYPYLNAVYLSLFDYGLGRKDWIGLGNYKSLFHDDVFIRSLKNTFGFVLGIVPTVIVFSLFVASLVIHKSKWSASFFRASFYLPIVTSQVILSITWLWIYNPTNGVANYLLSWAGMEPVLWLSDSKIALFSLILVVITMTVGQPIILYLAALGGIPSSYYEAAELDGASAWRKFWSVSLPLIKPTTLYVVVTSTVGAFQTFAVVQLLTGGGPNYSTSTIMYLLYNTAFMFGDLGLASAMGVILAAIISVISVVQFRLFKSEVEY